MLLAALSAETTTTDLLNYFNLCCRDWLIFF